MEKDLDNLKYPIGKFQQPDIVEKEQIEDWIKIIDEFPKKLTAEVRDLEISDLQKQYRPDGWTIMQVVNHCADSHMNSMMRFKLALTEDTPTIKPYQENLWAELSDAASLSHPAQAGMLKIIRKLQPIAQHPVE